MQTFALATVLRRQASGPACVNTLDNVLFRLKTLGNRGWNEPLTHSPPFRQKWARRQSEQTGTPFRDERQYR